MARKALSPEAARESHALTLDKGVFGRRSPRAIALSLKRSAERRQAVHRLFGKQKARSGDTCQIDD